MRLFLDKGIKPRQYSLKLILGNGAGYIWGATFFIALNCPNMKLHGALKWMRPKLIQFGLTRNANAVPYCNH